MSGNIAESGIIIIRTKRKFISNNPQNKYEASLKIKNNKETRSAIAKDLRFDIQIKDLVFTTTSRSVSTLVSKFVLANLTIVHLILCFDFILKEKNKKNNEGKIKLFYQKSDLPVLKVLFQMSIGWKYLTEKISKKYTTSLLSNRRSFQSIFYNYSSIQSI